MASVFDDPGRGFSWADCLPEADDRIWSWRLDGGVVSGLIARPIETLAMGRIVAIGMVCTSAHRRGRGFASALISAATDHYREQGVALAVLWAREGLVRFYRTLGFEPVSQDDDVRLSAPEANESRGASVSFREFDQVDHRGFERVRRRFNREHAADRGAGSRRRRMRDGHWLGISGGHGCRLGFVYAVSIEDPDFYGVVGYGGERTILLEFVGGPEELADAVAWIDANLGPTPVSYSVTSPHLLRQLDGQELTSRSKGFYSLVRPLSQARARVPVTTWLDRV